MFRLVFYEAVKTFLKKRTYLGFLIVGVIVPIVEVAMKVEGGRFIQAATRTLRQDFIFVGSLFNGWYVSYWMMQSLWVHIPLLITFVAGDQLAGEATSGTYRLILTRPVTRTKIFFSKYIVTLIYSIVFVLFLAILSIGLALILLGKGNLLVFDRGILILPAADVAYRFCAAYIFATWSIVTIASIAFFFSSFVENAIGPIVATMGLLVVFLILVVLPVEAFEPIRPYLFAQHMNLWQHAFRDPIAWDEIGRGIAVLGSYSAAAVGASWWIFTRKDILS
ncbi:MAG: hypothetical protein FJ215_06225 [Ignavibacteria bacterium]|nr:hypothetical protein [Ignavibacteria bacterium]